MSPSARTTSGRDFFRATIQHEHLLAQLPRDCGNRQQPKPTAGLNTLDSGDSTLLGNQSCEARQVRTNGANLQTLQVFRARTKTNNHRCHSFLWVEKERQQNNAELKKQNRRPSVSRTANKRFTQLLQFFDNFFAWSQDVGGMKNHIAFLVAPVLRLSIIHPVR